MQYTVIFQERPFDTTNPGGVWAIGETESKALIS